MGAATAEAGAGAGASAGAAASAAATAGAGAAAIPEHQKPLQSQKKSDMGPRRPLDHLYSLPRVEGSHTFAEGKQGSAGTYGVDKHKAWEDIQPCTEALLPHSLSDILQQPPPLPQLDTLLHNTLPKSRGIVKHWVLTAMHFQSHLLVPMVRLLNHFVYYRPLHLLYLRQPFYFKGVLQVPNQHCNSLQEDVYYETFLF